MIQKFEDLGLNAELVRAVNDEGYTEPTPVQAQAIPLILARRDVLAGAQTGTGKTAGFTLPMLQCLAGDAPRGQRNAVRALVLTPTRELAAQVEQSVRTYGKHLSLRSTLVYGGVGIQPQVDALRRGVDILVATPGRLLDHVGQKTVNLSQVEILVLDEADRMLDMGFINDIRKVLALLPKQRQNLLFSATFSDEIRSLAGGLLRDPAYVDVARRNMESALVAQRVLAVDAGRKRALLSHLISDGDWQQVLVFTRTKHGANRLSEQLGKDGIEAAAIHGNKSQGARTRALGRFKSGELRVLVATDLAARGLDIEQLPHVVNYEIPNVPEQYVHRIGRTGRAGMTGEAISLVSREENAFLGDIEKLIRRKLDREIIAGFEPGTAPSAAEASRNAERPRQDRGGKRPGGSGGNAGRGSRSGRPGQSARGFHGKAQTVHQSFPRAQETTPARQTLARDGERQPSTNANAQYPSSGPVDGGERRYAKPGSGRSKLPALLNGAPRR